MEAFHRPVGFAIVALLLVTGATVVRANWSVLTPVEDEWEGTWEFGDEQYRITKTSTEYCMSYWEKLNGQWTFMGTSETTYCDIEELDDGVGIFQSPGSAPEYSGEVSMGAGQIHVPNNDMPGSGGWYEKQP